MEYQDDEFSPNNNPGPRLGLGPFVDPQQRAQLVMAIRAAQQGGQGASAAPVKNSRPGAGASPLVDPQQLAQLLMAIRAAQQVRQGASAAQQTPPMQTLPASVLGPTHPFGAGVEAASGLGTLGPQLSVFSSDPNPAATAAKAGKIALLKSLLPAQANPPATQTPWNAASNVMVDMTAQMKAPSRIPRASAGPEVKPNLRVSDPKRVRTTLGELLRGIGGQQNAPLGVSPSGHLVRDVTYLTKAPSRIPRQYESGDYYSNVNKGWIKKNEGGSLLNGYVPRVKNGGDNSGVTIAAGFDLGQHKLADLRSYNLSADLIKRLSPYLGLTGQDARDALAKQPVRITRDEATQISDAAFDSNMNSVAQTFDKAAGAGAFARLPWRAQTVIGDLWYNMGNLPHPKVAPVFWKQVTTGDWEGAYRNLMNFSQADSRLAVRARDDAKLLRDAIDIGTLPSK